MGTPHRILAQKRKGNRSYISTILISKTFPSLIRRHVKSKAGLLNSFVTSIALSPFISVRWNCCKISRRPALRRCLHRKQHGTSKQTGIDRGGGACPRRRKAEQSQGCPSFEQGVLDNLPAGTFSSLCGYSSLCLRKFIPLLGRYAR